MIYKIKPRLIVIGAGGHGRSVVESVQLKNEFEFAGFLDDSWPNTQLVRSHLVHGNTNELHRHRAIADFVVVAIGNNQLRKELINKSLHAGFKLATIIHPTAIVSPSAIIGDGSTIMAGAIIGTDSKLGMGVIINSGANVDHDCFVADFAHLGVNACMAGNSSIAELAFLQAGSALGYGVSIPASTIIPPGTGVS